MRGAGDRGIMGKQLLSLALALGAVSPLHAGEFAYGLGYTISHSDNITRVPTDERSEVTNSYLAGIAYAERTSNLVARVFAQAEFRDYRDDVFGDEDIYDVDAAAIWVISPQRFTWTVEDRYDLEQIDATAADTPANRANVNVFSTGPDFYIRFTPVNTLALGARAGNVSSGVANVDNDRLSGSARWLYQATSISTYSLNIQAMDVNYDDSAASTDFSRHDLFLRADYRPSRSQYILDLGTSRIRPERGNDLDGSLARFSWIRQLTQESSFGASASGEYSDTGTDILATSRSVATTSISAAGLPVSPDMSGGGTVSDLLSNAITSDVYYAKRGEVFYHRRGSSFGIELFAGARDLDFETTPQDRKEIDGRLDLRFFYSGTTTVTLFTEYLKTEFVSFIREDTERDSGLRLNFRLTRTLSLGLEGRRVERSSTDPGIEYEENRAFLSLLYSSGALFTPVSSR